MDIPSIPEFFRDKEIFITGGSGFIGKALLEALLRTCPDIKVIYLLLRAKKGVAFADRLQAILRNGLFDKVRRNKPEALKKVVAISGDASELKLGLNEEDHERLLGVQVVFHVAASIRFDDPLKKATLLNTRGTREVMEMLLEMRNLEVAVHVSTTYCNTDKDVIEERVYRDHGDWREAIRIAEQYEDQYKVACITNKVLGGLKNTYTYTKHLAENVVEDYSDRLPLVLFRPGVVISSWKDPIPGWHDNFYGPVGFGMAVGKGILRTFYMGKDTLQDYMPVDMIVKAVLIATWQKKVNTSLEKLPTYNCSVSDKLVQTNDECGKAGVRACKIHPYNNALWYPVMEICENEASFRIKFVLKHFIPGLLMDLMLRISGKKPMLMALFRKMYFAVITMSYFGLINWDFRCEKMWGLVGALKPEDRQAFGFSFDGYNLDAYVTELVKGSQRFILNEPYEPAKAMRNHKRNAIIHYAFVTLFYGAIIYVVLNSSYASRIINCGTNLMGRVIH